MIKVINTEGRENYKPGYRLVLFDGIDIHYDPNYFDTVDKAVAHAETLMAVPLSERVPAYEFVAVMQELMIRRIVDE